MPARIQRKRSRGWKAPFDSQGRPPVYVGRGTRWGNPWAVAETRTGTGWAVNWSGARDQVPHGLRTEIPANDRRDAHALAVELYENWLYAQPELMERARRDLAGRDLMCWCGPLPCHADVLLGLVQGA
ncbi:DUF4326 domain-containing protein [Streptomyces sp. S186]|uniref:DUF4326 domain-containing protein n=1 Tax=Streptomyces sp. S186 TaxID=3434395 RepID=UPI003F67684E